LTSCADIFLGSQDGYVNSFSAFFRGTFYLC